MTHDPMSKSILVSTLHFQRMSFLCRKRGSREHNLQKAFRSPEREKMQRARRSSHSSSDYSVQDDNEMEAMAKVWAHPEDLHLFPVSVYRHGASLGH